MKSLESNWFATCTGVAPLREPGYVAESAWIEHTPFAFWVVDAVRPSLFVELGTHQGQSYMAFCQAIQVMESQCRALAVDTWRGDEHAGFYGQEIMDALRAVHDPKYRSFSQLLQMTFTEASHTIEDGSVDLLHIDGRHFAADVQADFDEWLPKMSDRGIVLMHGTQVRNNGFGVYEVWAQLSTRYPSFEFYHGRGLGVLAVGSSIPGPVRTLLESGQIDEGANLLRGFYSRLGSSVATQYERDQARQEASRISELDQDISHLVAQNVVLSQSMRKQQGDSRRALDGERKKASTARAELKALKASTSWKVTKPLRVFARARRARRARSGEVAKDSAGGSGYREAVPNRSQVARETELGVSKQLVTAADTRTRVLFLSGEPDTPGHRYRVADFADALPEASFQVEVSGLNSVYSLKDDVGSFDVVWFWRARYNNAAKRAIAAGRQSGARIVADIDDLVFASPLVAEADIDGYRSLGWDFAADGPLFRSRADVLSRADLRVGTTDTLVQALAGSVGPAVEIPNGYDAQAWALSDLAVATRADDGLFRIGYAGGTLTHQRDLAVAAPALARILRENRRARLVLFDGCVDLSEFPELMEHVTQIELRPKVPIAAMPFEYARFAVNIAPLELGNVFCESKSALKFFEAALVRVPTVATPTEPFRRLMRDGENGLFASDDVQWYEAISRLIGDSAERDRLADQARQDAIWNCGPLRRGRLIAEVIRDVVNGSQQEVPPVDRWPLVTHPRSGNRGSVVFESRRPRLASCTVVIVVRDIHSDVLATLESLRAQSLSDLDVVILNYWSGTGAPELVNWLADHRDEFTQLKLISLAGDVSTGTALNAAVSEAAGLGVAVVSGGYQLSQEALSSALEIIQRTGNAGVPQLDPDPSSDQDQSEFGFLISLEGWAAVGGFTESDDLWTSIREAFAVLDLGV